MLFKPGPRFDVVAGTVTRTLVITEISQ
jgi:hypothetical protein